MTQLRKPLAVISSSRVSFQLVIPGVARVGPGLKNRNEIFFAKASEAEIWTRVRSRYLTFFAGLHFKNEPGLTELDAAECRQNTPLCVSKRSQWRKRYSDVIFQAKITVWPAVPTSSRCHS